MSNVKPIQRVLGLWMILLSAGAHANWVTFEPDDFAVGTYVSTINPHVSLSTFRSTDDTSHVPVLAPVFVGDCQAYFGCASTTGSRVFQDAFGGIEQWGAFGGAIVGGTACFRALGMNTYIPECSGVGIDGDFNLLLMTFASPSDAVRISGAYANNDFPLLFGFDDAFNPVGSGSTTNPQCLESQEYCVSTASLDSTLANIRYVLAGGWSNNSSLDDLQFSVPNVTRVPEPDAFSLMAFALACMAVMRHRRRAAVGSEDWRSVGV
jgi:hypothetical protein